MAVLADLNEAERYLLALLLDQSGIDQAEFVWRDDTQPDLLFRCWDFQYCLGGETVMYTDRGRKPIRDCVGPVRLLTAGEGDTGRWVDASVAHFGRSQLFNVNLERRGIIKTIRATAGHRWFAGAGRADRRVYAEKVTTELQPGDLLQPTHAPIQNFSLNEDSVRAGIVFGDGTVYGSKSRVYLWGEKIKLLEWFPRSQPTPVNRPDVNVPGRYVGNLPLRYKTWTPAIWDDLGRRWGWLAGYFATDGSVDDRGTCIITSRDPDAIDTVRDIATSLGVVCSPVRQRWAEDSKKPGMQFIVVLRVTDLPLDFFLLDHHRQRAAIRRSGTYRAVDAWKVVDVVPGEVDETYCAVVPGTHSFVLDDDILTGNSWYRHQDKFQIDQCGRALGKSVGIQMRAFSFPFVNPGEEMLVTAPEMIHLDPVTKNIEDRLESCRLSREFLKRSGTSNGFSHRPFEAKFRNGARIVGRIPQKDGRGVKGSLGLDMTVTTPAGPRPIGDIQVGDRVLTAYNRFMPVLHIYRHVAPCVMVCSDTRWVVASDNHRVMATRGDVARHGLMPPWVIVDDEELDTYSWALLVDGRAGIEPIRSVSPLGDREVVDLVVAEDFSYVAEGVVHKGSRFLPGDDVTLRN